MLCAGYVDNGEDLGRFSANRREKPFAGNYCWGHLIRVGLDVIVMAESSYRLSKD